MGTMLNSLLSVFLLVWIGLAQADDYGVASKMAESGAKELALSYMQQHPEKPDLEWGSLEIRLLSEFGKDGQVLDVADQLPFSKETAELAIRSAFNLEKPQIARTWLARLIWNGNLSKSELRKARLQVIASYIMEKDGKSGYYAMLRFSQDYHPLSNLEAQEFVSGLVASGMAKDSLSWLVLLDDKDPAKIMAELETGLSSPDDAIKAAGGKHPEILLEAAKMKNDPSLEIEAKERLLAENRISGNELWKSYLSHAILFSNRYALLQGDYNAWPDSISRIPDPYAQRSLLAYLSTRDSGAIPLLVDALKEEPEVASKLFSKFKNLPVGTRQDLGKMAFGIGDYANCAAYWEGAALQDDLPDLAFAQLKAGKPHEAATSILQYLEKMKALDPKAASRILALTKQLADLKAPECKEILTSLLRLVDSSAQKEVLMLLGKSAADPRDAAAYYFRASVLPGDESSKKARLACIASLRKAGFVDDAKALESRK